MIAISKAEEMELYFVDIPNAYQTNVIIDPTKQHFIGLPPMMLTKMAPISNSKGQSK